MIEILQISAFISVLRHSHRLSLVPCTLVLGQMGAWTIFRVFGAIV